MLIKHRNTFIARKSHSLFSYAPVFALYARNYTCIDHHLINYLCTVPFISNYTKNIDDSNYERAFFRQFIETG